MRYSKRVENHKGSAIVTLNVHWWDMFHLEPFKRWVTEFIYLFNSHDESVKIECNKNETSIDFLTSRLSNGVDFLTTTVWTFRSILGKRTIIASYLAVQICYKHHCLATTMQVNKKPYTTSVATLLTFASLSIAQLIHSRNHVYTPRGVLSFGTTKPRILL